MTLIGQSVMQYTGHTGSVNSLRFHPTKELVLTASGDGSVHIWQVRGNKSRSRKLMVYSYITVSESHLPIHAHVSRVTSEIPRSTRCRPL